MRDRRLVFALVVASVLFTACASRQHQATLERTTFGVEADVTLSAMTFDSSGYFYRDMEVGTGDEAVSGRTVRVLYIVRLADGKEIDRSARDAPLRFRVGARAVVRALDLGVRGMRVGGTRQLVLPPALGYGVRGAGPVPPNAVLVMVVRLEGVDGAP